MGSPDSSSKTSLLLLLALLGSLGVLSTVLIFGSFELPGVSTGKRALANETEMRTLQNDLHKALASLSSWEQLCKDPYQTIKDFKLAQQQRILFVDPRWVEARPFLPRSERDASFRCRSTRFDPGELRAKFCFHIAGPEGLKPPAPESVNILELNLEWYGKDTRKPLSCSAALASGSISELSVYYSFYRSTAQKSEQWAFTRMTGGMRLAIRPDPARGIRP